MSPKQLLRRFRLLILLSWTIPPVIGLGLLIYIGMFTPIQMLTILSDPLEPLSGASTAFLSTIGRFSLSI